MQTIQDLKALGTKAAYLSGGGEPTTYKGWEVYAEKILEYGMEVALITNSIAIQERHYQTLKKFNYIAVSVYSTKEEQYKKIVGSNFFSKQFALPKKLKNSDDKVIIGARCVINSVNYEDIFNIYEKAMQEAFDYIIFIPAVDYEKRKIDLTDKEKESVMQQIDERLGDIDVRKTNLINIKNNGIGHYGKHYLPQLRKNFICSAIMMRSNVFINYDGEVYLCQPLIGQKEYSIGNLNQARFSELWNSDRHCEVIGRLNQKFAKGCCENCRAISYNLSIDNLLQGKEMGMIPTDNFL